MALRKMQSINAEIDEAKKKYADAKKALQDAVEAAWLEYAKKTSLIDVIRERFPIHASYNVAWRNARQSEQERVEATNVFAGIHLDLPEEFHARLKPLAVVASDAEQELRNLQRYSPKLSDIRKEIRGRASGDDRIAAILADGESVKVLDEALASIFPKPVKAEAETK